MEIFDNLFFQPGEYIRAETVLGMFLDGKLVDGRAGGLVIGKSHEAGHIYMIQRSEEDVFIFLGVLEGNEYLLCYEATDLHFELIEEMNRDVRPVSNPVIPDIFHCATRVINTHAAPNDKLLLIDERGQFVVNAVSTKRYFNELQALNDKYASRTHFSMKEFFIRKKKI